MSLLGTLGKVAMGIMVAKTVGKAMGGSGGLGGMLGGLMGGKQADNTQNAPQGGGLGDLLGSLTGGNTQGGGLGNLLNDALAGKKVDLNPSQEEQAMVLLKAMIAAAKADGEIDASEQAKITEHIGDVTPAELEFVKTEMQAPLDVNAIVSAVPAGMEQQVYLMSLLAIDLDNEKEAHYLDSLAKGLRISQTAANDIHAKVGAPQLYRS